MGSVRDAFREMKVRDIAKATYEITNEQALDWIEQLAEPVVMCPVVECKGSLSLKHQEQTTMGYSNGTVDRNWNTERWQCNTCERHVSRRYRWNV